MALRSDKELSTELSRIADMMLAKDNWERRLEGLQQLRRILETDASKFESFLPILSQTIKVPLQQQIVELRSTISREACLCVRSLAHSAAAGAAEAVSDWYIRDLYNNSCATIAIIAQTADETLRDMAACGRLNRAAVLAFLAGCSSKHAVIRKNAFNYLLVILHSVDPSVLQKHIGQIEKLLKAGVVDAVQEARKASRLGVWALERVFPKAARDLIDTFETATRKAVEADRGAFDEWMHTMELPEHSRQQHANVSRQPQARASSPAAPRSGRPSSTPAAPPPPPSQAAGSRTGLTQLRATPSQQAASVSPSPDGHRYDHVDSAQSRHSQQQQHTAASSSPPSAGYAARRAVRSRSSTGASAESRSPDSAALPARPSSRATAITDVGAATLPPSALRPARERPSTTGGTVTTVVPDTVSSAGGSRGGPRGYGSAGAAGGGASDDPWYTSIEGSSGSDWLSRLRSFDAITEFLAAGSLSLARASECLPAVLQHLSDTHYRVVVSVMHTLDALVEKFPDVVSPHLDKLLIPLFQRLSDTKKQVCEKAKSTLDSLRLVYGVDTLVPVLHKVLDFNNAKVRVAALDFMVYLLVFGSDYFATPAALRATVHRMLTLVAHKPPADVHRAAMAMLSRLYDRHREAFAAQICVLSPSEQSDAIELLRKTIPQIGQDCRRLQNGEPLLRHPTASAPASATVAGQQFATPVRGQVQLDNSPAAAPSPARGFSAQRAGARQPQQGTSSTGDGRNPQFQDPFAKLGGPSAAGLLDATTLIPASPIAQWRQEKAMPQELTAFRVASTGDERRAALRSAQAALRTNMSMWLDHFLRLIAFPLSYVSDPADHGVRIEALRLIRAIATSETLTTQALAHHEPMLRAAISCLDDPFPEAQSEAMSCFREIATNFEPAAVLRSLISIAEALMPLNARCTEFLLRELVSPFRPKQRASGIGGHYIDPSLLLLLPSLIDVLTTAFAHHQSDIRKTAVLDFVDLYIALGDALLPRIAHLNHSQLKLISIYIVRAGVTPDPVDLVVKMIDSGIIAARYC